MFFWNPCCRQGGGRKSGGWFAHVDRPRSNGPSRRGQPSGRGTATWPAPMKWTPPPRQWRTRVRPSKPRADYLCECIFPKYTARLLRRLTAHINSGAVLVHSDAVLLRKAVPPTVQASPCGQRLKPHRRLHCECLSAQRPGQFQGKNALAQRPDGIKPTTTQHTPRPQRGFFASGHAIKAQAAKGQTEKDMAEKARPACPACMSLPVCPGPSAWPFISPVPAPPTRRAL